MPDAKAAVESVFRRESGRIVATLIRLAGSFELAEEAMQEAFATALTRWPETGIPDNPGAWITTTAHHKLIDHIRRERTRREKQGPLQYEIERSAPGAPDLPFEEPSMTFPDDRLRLIFTCCHPALNQPAQVALTLRTLGGLTTPEVARACLVSETTLAQRLVRAKNKIRSANIPYQVPAPHLLQDRLASVQAVIYLIFNEGYSATAGEHLIRGQLCAEAVRLARMLCELLPNEPENLGLLAMMLLHGSRRNARVDSQGQLVSLEEQDRSLWNSDEIDEGLALTERALRMRSIGPYQLQAAIAAVHAESKTARQTDWTQIAALYRQLARLTPSPVISLNHAVAVAMSEGLEQGLALIDQVGASGELDDYYLLHAARADILRRLGRQSEALDAYTRALALANNKVEQAYLRRRMSEAGI